MVDFHLGLTEAHGFFKGNCINLYSITIIKNQKTLREQMPLKDNWICFTQRYLLRTFICHITTYRDHKDLEKSHFLNTYHLIGSLF